MRVVTPKQMSRIEERSEKLGVTRKQLMENAGEALAEFIDGYCRREENSAPENRSVVFLAGTGNNGGDCFAAANILVYRGYRITVINVGGMPKTDLAKEMFGRLPKERMTVIDGFRSENVEAAMDTSELDYMNLPKIRIPSGKSKKDLNPLETMLLQEKQRMSLIKNSITDAAVVVDGVFGTSFHGTLSEDVAALFRIRTDAFKIAVDVPSGGNCTSGTITHGLFKADATIALGFLKTGMTQFPLKKYCGKITVADIGIPPRAIGVISSERSYYRIERNQFPNFPPKREPDAHKGTFGSVLIIAGSAAMRGAAAFSVLGALRSGAGKVRLFSTEQCINTVSVLAPEAMFLAAEPDDYGFMSYDPNVQLLQMALKSADAILIGCGMGVSPDTMELTRFVLKNAEVPVIVDADGINCIASDIDILLQKKTDVIITPHVGEMARLLNCENSMVMDNRIVSAEKYAEKYGITVVLKGAGTIIADSRYTAFNHTGNPGMSRGGSGDILAGMVASAVAQGCEPFDAACATAYLHGLAGDVAAQKLGVEAMLSRDIIDSLSDSFRILNEKVDPNRTKFPE